MIRPAALAMTLVLTTASLAGCGEPSQSIGNSARDAAPYAAGGPPAFQSGAWQAGDASGWEREVRERTKRGQNEYTRTR